MNEDDGLVVFPCLESWYIHIMSESDDLKQQIDRKKGACKKV